MSTTTRTQVVVVGAGPTGVTAAILLAQRGIETLVLDRWNEVYPQPRAVHLDDEVHRLLARAGLGEAFSAISRPGLGLQTIDRNGKVIGRFARLPESSRNGYPQANMYDQPALEQIMRDRLAQLPRATFRGNADVTRVEARPSGGATVSYADRRTGVVEEVHADFVLGADGAHSLVRGQMGARLEPLKFEQRWCVVDAEIDGDLGLWEGVHQLCDPERAGTYMRVGETRHRWEFQLLEGETVEDYRTFEQIEPVVQQWLGGRYGAQGVTILRTAEYVFRAAVADRWRRGAVFLLGDAAHLSPPFIGQGLGAGLRDADNLTWKIAGVLEGRLDPVVLDTYERERRPHARELIQLARILGRVMTTGGRPGAVGRRFVGPPVSVVLNQLEFVGRGATPRLTSSALRHRAPGERLAGRLVPNVCGGGLLDADLQGRWSLVTAEPLAPSVLETLDGL